nr:TetR/AcrR family transcriptional regulator [Actinomadura rayongensis]
MEAARRLLQDEGYAGLNIRTVAKGAGISAGAVYTYFASKEQLFAALYARRLEEFHTEIVRETERAATAEDLFVAVADRYLPVYRVYGRELNVWSAMFDEGGFPPEVALPLAEAALRIMDTLVAAFARIDPALAGGETAVTFLWANLNGLADHFTSSRSRLHAVGWHDTIRFAARTIAAGLRQVPSP